jgi:AraC-like DNA-binding protein
VHRYDHPQDAALDKVDSLSLCAVVSGRKNVRIDGRRWQYDPMNYLVLTRETQYSAQVVQATPHDPYLSLALHLEPALVRQVAAEINERTLTVLCRPVAIGADPDRPAFISPFDGDLAGALVRLLSAISTASDRRVLAPLYLREIAYRLLQADQRDRLLQALADADTDPVSVAARYMRANLARSLTVGQIATQVDMSPSAFAHLFKEVTGTSPYQFLTQVRLERGRSLLASSDLAVGEVAKAVGYATQSHFSREFRRRFGTSPRAYVQDLATGAAG